MENRHALTPEMLEAGVDALYKGGLGDWDFQIRSREELREYVRDVVTATLNATPQYRFGDWVRRDGIDYIVYRDDVTGEPFIKTFKNGVPYTKEG